MMTIASVIINYQLKHADGPISNEISESVNYVILVLLVMNNYKYVLLICPCSTSEMQFLSGQSQIHSNDVSMLNK